MPDGARGERPAQTFAERTLVDVVRGESEAAEPTEALRELLRRRPERTPLLAEVVRDRKRPPETRATAAVALGRQPAPAARSALVSALRDPDPSVLRRAAESLGKIGDREALSALERVDAPRGPARRSVDFAKTLISYRLGLDEHRVKRPPAREELEVDRRRAERLRARKPAPGALERALAGAAEELPAVPLTEEGALRFTCGDHEFVVLLAQELARRPDVAPLRARSAVVGAVLERSPVEDRYFLSEYLLTDPWGRGSSLRLFGVRPNGAVAHVGEAAAEENATFELRALDTRYSPPVSLEGSFDPERNQLRFTELLVHPDMNRGQKQPAEPTKIDFVVE